MRQERHSKRFFINQPSRAGSVAGMAVLVSLAVISQIPAVAQQTAVPPRPMNEAATVSVNVLDLIVKVELLGRFGTPFGKLMTLRGTWEERFAKEDAIYFRVTEVNGKELDRPIEFPGSEVYPSIDWGTLVPAPDGVGWEWKGQLRKSTGAVAAPRPQDQEEWEITCAETARTMGLPTVLHDAVGAAAQTGPRGFAFETSLHFVKAKRLVSAK